MESKHGSESPLEEPDRPVLHIAAFNGRTNLVESSGTQGAAGGTSWTRNDPGNFASNPIRQVSEFMMTDKALLKTTMLNLATERLAYSERAYADYLHRSSRDQGEVGDHGDVSQQFGDAEIAQAFECPIQTHTEALDTLRAIDFGPKQEVVEGACVRLSGRWFVIAIATTEFVCDGITYMGISRQAPIFEAMQGKAAGDVFEFNGRKMRIEAVA